MDCAMFIRSRRVLAGWVAVPMLLLITLHMAATGFYRHQKISFEQKQTLNQMIPEMQREANTAARFLDSCRIGSTGTDSLQDYYIGLINNSAHATGFKAEKINIDSDPFDKGLHTHKLAIRLQGAGTLRQITEFLNMIKISDPMICENTLKLLPSTLAGDVLKLEAELIKVYTE